MEFADPRDFVCNRCGADVMHQRDTLCPECQKSTWIGWFLRGVFNRLLTIGKKKNGQR